MKNDIFSLKGKVAVITGGYRGIGKSVATYLADAGADIGILMMQLRLLRKSEKNTEFAPVHLFVMLQIPNRLPIR